MNAGLVLNVRLCTLDEVDEHLQVPDLGFELLHQLLLHPGWVDDLSDRSIYSVPQLLGR